MPQTSTRHENSPTLKTDPSMLTNNSSAFVIVGSNADVLIGFRTKSSVSKAITMP